MPLAFGVGPPAFGAVPIGWGVMPFAFGIVPIEFGVMPFAFGVVPVECGVMPFAFGVVPIGWGVMPFGFGVMPLAFGVGPAPGAPIRSSRIGATALQHHGAGRLQEECQGERRGGPEAEGDVHGIDRHLGELLHMAEDRAGSEPP